MPLCAFKQLLVAVIIPPVCTGHDKISSESHYKGSAAGKKYTNTRTRLLSAITFIGIAGL